MLVNLFSLLMGYLAGFATLAIPLSLWAYRVHTKHSKIVDDAEKDTKNKQKKQEEIGQKMRKVKAIIEMQNELIAQTQTPSASALHSKNKNELTNKVKNLEEEKIGILESIVKDGYDPVIVVADPATGEHVERKLSDFLSMHKQDAHEPQQPQPNATAGARKVEKRGNLFVVDGGEEGFDDDGGNDGGPTYH